MRGASFEPREQRGGCLGVGLAIQCDVEKNIGVDQDHPYFSTNAR